MYKLLLVLFVGLLTISCSNVEQKAVELATENLKLSVENSEQLKVLGVSKVDSAFGVNYFTPNEIRSIFEVTKNVTEKIMRQTGNLMQLENADVATMALIERQMKASTEVRSLLSKADSKKGDFSGYKLKIDYQSQDMNGTVYKAERWFFIDKDGNQVLKTFELPLP